MEGVGSRQSRASSRYSSSPSAPVFNGPVRKWKKQWVSSRSNNQHNGSSRNDAPPLLLCRWTPLSATAEEPRKRFRYAPIVPIEKGKSEGKEKVGNEAANQSNNSRNMVHSRDVSPEETQELNDDRLESNKSLGAGQNSEENRVGGGHDMVGGMQSC